MNEVTVENFHELYEALKKYQNERMWMFRGHRDPIKWRLIPKAGRSDYFVRNEISIFEAWKRRAIEFTRVIPPNDWQWLAVAQHHGFSTRLLDWSGNPLVACFFAVAGLDDDKGHKDAVLYAFKPKFTVKDDVIKNSLQFDISPFIESEKYPIIRYIPGAFAARISRQDARFTIHSPSNFEITGADNEGILDKITIKECYVKDLRKELDKFGYNHSTIFPDLDGMSKYLNWIGSERDLIASLIDEQKEIENSASTISHKEETKKILDFDNIFDFLDNR